MDKKDDLSFTCDASPITHWNALTLPPCSSSLSTSVLLYVVYIVGCFIRYGILLPIRLNLMIMAALFISCSSIILTLLQCSQEQRLYLCKAFSRLFSSAMGLVARYEGGKKNRPKPPGIVVSNHMSANDVQVIAADIQYEDPIPTGFSITGQRHTGFIGWAERMGGKITNALWFERADEGQRRDFRNKVLSVARDVKNDPILMFPEGYCTNNTMVYQFRRAVFADGIDIYPIALKQDPRLGEAFWLDDSYVVHLLRIMTSWATVYNIKYLPKMRKKKGESSEEFAKRVQSVIAEAVDIDGVLVNNDPTAHAEVIAIRNACEKLGTYDLKGCVLYTSCYPCPMCFGAALWSRVDAVFYAATAKDAAKSGFDDAKFYEILRNSEQYEYKIEHLEIDGCMKPFMLWNEKQDKIPY
uniref:CMP/dCMP-type deaminase domain-containing protein n=1 Tax=Acrobeloides nanus TaxID=290746 RepID=A0A914CJN3_9BILA